MRQKGIAPILIVVLLALALGGYLLYTKQAETTPIQPTPTPSSTPDASPVPNGTGETANPDLIGANWKTYVGSKYSFRYPSDWNLTTSEYLNSKNLTNHNGSTAITFSDEQYPYGFEDPNMKFETQQLKIKLGEKEYDVKGTIINNSKLFVDFKTDPPNVVHILFGTGYPAAEDKKASLQDYQKDKDTILQILSTFKFQ